MCIALVSSSHPKYPFVLLSNRDEYFQRPTKEAHIRKLENDGNILSPIDMAREEHGSWIGVTDKGKLAVLLNYSETDMTKVIGELSRGMLPIEYLQSKGSTTDWLENLRIKVSKRTGTNFTLEQFLERIGGFTLLFGQLALEEGKGISPMSIISNRGDMCNVFDFESDLKEDSIANKKTFGLSNSLYHIKWPKVLSGEEHLENLVSRNNINDLTSEEFLQECFAILDLDTYDKNIKENGTLDEKLTELRNSIFIPPLDVNLEIDASRDPLVVSYGTRTQTVVLLTKEGVLHYFERQTPENCRLNPELDINTHHFSFKLT